ncbi:MAG: peptidoglycan DD-metalloendopeptidase family protein [Acidimicrobiales bacterium]
MPRHAMVCALALTVGTVMVTAAPVAAESPPRYLPPVAAPVVDAFRAPSQPYGAGNRGLEYGTSPGTEVHASATGVVTFAGVVAGSRHVTVLHDDGLRTSYSFLSSVAVVVGQHVPQGAVVGTTIDHLHFGARSGDSYLDPASLFGGSTVRLVPFDDPPGDGPAGERSAIRQLIGGIGGAITGAVGSVADAAVAGTGATADWLRQEGPQVARTAIHYLHAAGPGGAPARLLRGGMRAWAATLAATRGPCTPGGLPPPAPPVERRVAVLVGGLGSSSDRAAIDDVDTMSLGYEPSDVLRFSYAGGRIPDPADGLAAVPARPYAPPDTQVDLRASGARLADLIEAIADATPGVSIDLYAHSQGGLVTRLALIELEARHGGRWLERLGLVATLGTPHGGADLATALYAIGTTQAGSLALDLVAGASGHELDEDAIAVRQLAETSQVIADLAETPIPPGVRAVSIAARGDLIVPVPRTELAGATEVVVPVQGLHAHDALPGSAPAARELALALAGRAPICRSVGGVLVDQILGEGISWAEDSLGAQGWSAAAVLGFPLLG